MHKILILLFTSLNLLGFDYYFSLENNSINIKRNVIIDIVFNVQAFDVNSGDFAGNKWVQQSISIKENNASGKRILFDTTVKHEQDSTFSLYPKNMKSNFTYFIEVKGSRFKNRLGDIAVDKNMSFSTADFLDIVYPKEVNISLSSDKIINIALSEAPSQDMKIQIYNKDKDKDKNITISPSIITLSSLNYMDGVDVTISTSNKLLKTDGNYSLLVKNDSLGITKKIKLTVVKNNISLVTNMEYSFSPQMTKNLSIHLSKPAFEPYEVKISNTKSTITLSKKTLEFTRDNFGTSQNIIINAKAIIVDTNDTILVTSRDINKSFDIKIIVPKEPVVEENTTVVEVIEPITIVKNTSLFSQTKWGAKKAYKGKFSIFIGSSRENVNLPIGDVETLTYTSMHKPNLTYFLEVKYKDDLQTLGVIEIKPPKVNLVDSDKDGLSDDLEELFNTSGNTTDSNNDNIADVIQDYLLKIENKAGKTLSNYTLSSDMDNDKIGDILELNTGRDPTRSGFNGHSALSITVPSDGVAVYVANFSELKTASGISSSHNASINGYMGDSCLNNGILVANFLTLDTCKDITTETFTIGNKTIIWVAIDDFGNIAYKKQILSVFEKSNTGSSSAIIFTVDDINYTIKSTRGQSVSFGNLATSKSYQNPIVFESDTLASEFEFTNNIFDIIIQSNGGVASVVIKQPTTLKSNSYFRIFKDGKYHIFNTSQGDKVSSTKGNNNQCNFSDIYQESLHERDYCIKLDIKDGGLNDSDGLLNGSVSLIGGASTTPKIISINDNDSIGCSSLHASGIDGKKAKFDYLMVFAFLISFAYVVRMFAKKRY